MGMLMIGFSLIACTKEVDLLEPNLDGLYKYKSAAISTPVKFDKNDIYYSDLILVDGTECIWDNTWQFLNGKAILREGETSCLNVSEETEKNAIIETYDYIYNKENNTIKLIYNDGPFETFKNVKIGYTHDHKQFLSFELWSEEIKQIVRYYLVAE